MGRFAPRQTGPRLDSSPRTTDTTPQSRPIATCSWWRRCGRRSGGGFRIVGLEKRAGTARGERARSRMAAGARQEKTVMTPSIASAQLVLPQQFNRAARRAHIKGLDRSAAVRFGAEVLMRALNALAFDPATRKVDTSISSDPRFRSAVSVAVPLSLSGVPARRESLMDIAGRSRSPSRGEPPGLAGPQAGRWRPQSCFAWPPWTMTLNTMPTSRAPWSWRWKPRSSPPACMDRTPRRCASPPRSALSASPSRGVEAPPLDHPSTCCSAAADTGKTPMGWLYLHNLGGHAGLREYLDDHYNLAGEPRRSTVLRSAPRCNADLLRCGRGERRRQASAGQRGGLSGPLQPSG